MNKKINTVFGLTFVVEVKVTALQNIVRYFPIIIEIVLSISTKPQTPNPLNDVPQEATSTVLYDWSLLSNEAGQGYLLKLISS